MARILDAVARAVDVPVTLKIRTGFEREHRNGVSIARIAEDCGVAALAVHGRTRADFFAGEAEYHTIREIEGSCTSQCWRMATSARRRGRARCLISPAPTEQ